MKNSILRSGTGNYVIKTRLSLLSGLALFLLLPSCTLFKRLPRIRFVQESGPLVRDTTIATLKNNLVADTSDVKKQLISDTKSIWGKKTSFRTFSTKAKMHYEDGEKSYDFVANIRMQKDSVIWVTVTVGGLIQVARAIVTPDSFKAVVFVQKEAYVGPVSKANAFLPAGIDFYALQNLLIGDPVLSGGKATDATNFGGTWSYRFEQSNYIQQLNYNKSDSSLRSCQVVTTGQEDKALNVQYGDYGPVGDRFFSGMRKLSIINGTKQIQVDMNYNNSSFDVEQSYPFSIPQNYELK